MMPREFSPCGVRYFMPKAPTAPVRSAVNVDALSNASGKPVLESFSSIAPLVTAKFLSRLPGTTDTSLVPKYFSPTAGMQRKVLSAGDMHSLRHVDITGFIRHDRIFHSI